MSEKSKPHQLVGLVVGVGVSEVWEDAFMQEMKLILNAFKNSKSLRTPQSFFTTLGTIALTLAETNF